MTLLSGPELQAARRAAADRFLAIGLAHVPPGFEVMYRRDLSGWCRNSETQKQIVGPKPVTRRALYIFLHECAHAHLHPAGHRKPKHVVEFEAETWAHEKMRAAGVAVPRSSTKRAKRYVARKIKQAVRRGAKRIDADARRYAEGR